MRQSYDIRVFGRICNPHGLSISIFNAIFRIKIGFDFRFARRFSIPFGRRPLVPNTHCVGIIPTKIPSFIDSLKSYEAVV